MFGHDAALALDVVHPRHNELRGFRAEYLAQLLVDELGNLHAEHPDEFPLNVIAELRHKMQVGFARLETAIERSRSDLMKWSFVFCVGAVISIAVLAKLLR